MKLYLLLAALTMFAVAPLALPIPEPVELCPMGMSMAEMAAMYQDPPQDGPPVVIPPSDEPPEGNPNHEVPTEFCRSNDDVHPCMCVRLAPEGCQQGHREIEHRSCNSFCWKNFCKCCSS